MRTQKSAGGLWLLLFVLLAFLGAFAYFAFISDNPPWGNTTSGGGTNTAATSPIVEGPFWMVKTNDAATGKATMEVRWKTNAAFKGQVEYGIDTNYGSVTPLEPDFITDHVATLADLKQSTSYRYRVILKDKSNKEWKYEAPPGTTPPPPTPAQ
jgi:hypothetical protein